MDTLTVKREDGNRSLFLCERLIVKNEKVKEYCIKSIHSWNGIKDSAEEA